MPQGSGGPLLPGVAEPDAQVGLVLVVALAGDGLGGPGEQVEQRHALLRRPVCHRQAACQNSVMLIDMYFKSMS